MKLFGWHLHIAALIIILLSGCHATPQEKEEKPPAVLARSEKIRVIPQHLIIGTFAPLGTDAGCWLYRQATPKNGQIILYYEDNDNAQMNINGEIVQLKAIVDSNNKNWTFQGKNLKVVVNTGKAVKSEGRCGISYSFQKAQITVWKDELTTTIPAYGECGCGD